MRAAPLVALALVQLLRGGAALGAKVELLDYTVQKGDNCPAIARRLYGNPRYINLIHEHNELGPTPHRLKEGQVLRLPKSRDSQPTEPDARLTGVRNDVDTYTPEQHRGRLQEALNRGHQVGTLADSAAEVTFADEMQLRLGEHTLVVILGREGELARRAKPSDTTLLRGSLRAFLGGLGAPGPAARPLPLRTPGGAQVAVGQGEAQVSVDREQTTRLSVYRGRSSLRSRGKKVDVPQGFGASAPKGRPPTPPRPLPAAPQWLDPPPASLTAEGATAALRGRVGAGTGGGPAAAAWHLQVARDAAFRDVVLDQRVEERGGALEGLALAPGSYQVRVSAVDAEGFEGPFGPERPLKVLAPPEPAPQPLQAAVPLARVHRAPAPPPPQRPEEPGAPRWTAEVALSVGAAQTLERQFALGGFGEVGLQRRLFWGGLTAGLRAGYEGYVADRELRPSYLAMLPLGFRFNRYDASWRPYLAVAPGLVLTPGLHGAEPWPLIAGLVGLQLRLGPGWLALELGYRHSFGDRAPGGAVHESLGYRIHY